MDGKERYNLTLAEKFRNSAVFGDQRDKGLTIGDKEIAPALKRLAGIVTLYSSFFAPTPLFWINAWVIFSMGLALGMAVSLDVVEAGYYSVSMTDPTTASTTNAVSLVIFGCLLGYLVVSTAPGL